MLWLLIACTVVDTDTADSGTTPVDSGQPGDLLDQIDPSNLPAAPNPCRAAELVTIDYVIDGDTAKVISSRGRESVRFIGVNTAEVGWDGEASECWGDEARDFTSQHLEGGRVWLTFDVTCTDYYDRTLAYLFTSDDEQGFFNRVLVHGGWGEAYPFDDTPTFIDEFEEDEAYARANDLGGWSACGW